jgi:predicted kinase
MEMILFVGAQAAGKSSFYKFRFSDTHVRINLDMLRTRHREKLLVKACLEARQPLVIDNTNATRTERQRYFRLATDHGCKVSGFYFQSIAAECLARNKGRNRGRLGTIPDAAVRNTIARLEHPSMQEGFERLQFVRLSGGEFVIEDWKNEI